MDYEVMVSSMVDDAAKNGEWQNVANLARALGVGLALCASIVKEDSDYKLILPMLLHAISVQAHEFRSRHQSDLPKMADEEFQGFMRNIVQKHNNG